MNDGMTPDLYLVLRTTSINGVVVERDRYMANFAKHEHADAFCNRANDQLVNASSELKGIDVIFFIKPCIAG